MGKSGRRARREFPIRARLGPFVAFPRRRRPLSPLAAVPRRLSRSSGAKNVGPARERRQSRNATALPAHSPAAYGRRDLLPPDVPLFVPPRILRTLAPDRPIPLLN